MRTMVWGLVIIHMFMVCILPAQSQTSSVPEDIVFDAPRQEGGMGVLSALKARESIREYEDQAIPESLLGDLLWAAFGINRPEEGRRTAPSSFNWQDVDIYVFTADGVWRYDAEQHQLVGVKSGDHRELAGVQEYVHTAPLSLVYVSDFDDMTHEYYSFSETEKLRTGALHTGHISQNVYLFCASEGLGAVARGSVDRERFSEAFGLSASEHVMMGQTVGFPAE